MVPPCPFPIRFSCLAVLRIPLGFARISVTGLSPSSWFVFHLVLLSSLLPYHGPSTPVLGPVWASPLSLAATQGITVVFFSSGYLDVSVRRVPLLQAMYSPADDSSCLLPGSPIRTPPLLRFLTASRSFSQFGASFFSFEWQGIRRTPFLT